MAGGAMRCAMVTKGVQRVRCSYTKGVQAGALRLLNGYRDVRHGY